MELPANFLSLGRGSVILIVNSRSFVRNLGPQGMLYIALFHFSHFAFV